MAGITICERHGGHIKTGRNLGGGALYGELLAQRLAESPGEGEASFVWVPAVGRQRH